jgi:PAS domain S-box-containing protein
MQIKQSMRFAGLLFGMAFSWLNAEGAEPRRVLLLHSFGRDFEPFITFSETFRSELSRQSPEPLDFFDVALGSARFEGAQEAPFVDYLRALFAGHRVDLIVPMGGPACRFAQRYRARLFPDTPMLVTCVEERMFQRSMLTTNDAVLSVRHDPKLMVEAILRLLPATTNVAVVFGNSPLENFWSGEFKRAVQSIMPPVGSESFSELSFTQMKARAATLAPRSVMIYGQLLVDADGVPQTRDALQSLHAVANAPVFGIHEFQLGRGIVGGPLIPVRELSRRSASAAARILQGEAPANFRPSPLGYGAPTYDWRELRRWRIAERSLPPGSIVQFREKTIWERYRGWIIVGLSVLVVEGAIIGSLLLNRRRRRRAEEALARSERDARSQLGQLSAIYRATPTGLAFLDTELRYVSINDHLAKIHRLPAAAHIGRTLREVLGNLADDIEPTCRRVIEQGEPITDLEVRRREAAAPEVERVWLASYHPVKNEGGSVLGVSAVVNEITARKHEEETLRNIAEGVSAKTGETFFQSLAEHISSALQLEYAFVCEVCEGGACARTITSYVNGKAAENIDYVLAGTPCEEVLRRGMAVYPQGVQKSFPEDQMLVEIAAESYLGVCLKDSTGKPLGLMAVMSRKPLVHIEAAQSMLSIFAARAAAELERKQAEDRLRAREQDLRVSEERYREVVESQTDLVCRFLPDGTLTFVNGAYCRFFGYPREEIIGRKFFDFIPEENRAAAMENVARLNKERRPLEVEHEVLLPDGNIGWQHWANHPVVGRDGEVTEFQGIGRDITDRKRADEANFRLAHATRLAMVGELTAVVVHELSQPLSAMLCNARAAELMLENSNPPPLEDLHEIMRDIQRDNRRASESVHRMRTLMRMRRLELKPLDLSELVADVLQIASGEAARRRVQIKTERTGEFPPVKGDRVHLQQVLLNLILNGMDAMDNTPESRRCLRIRMGENDHAIEVAITDAGHGIPLEKLPRIFDSFYTTKDEGLGLGLSISKWIIEAHRGRILAENDANGGATFRFTLPTNGVRVTQATTAISHAA